MKVLTFVWCRHLPALLTTLILLPVCFYGATAHRSWSKVRAKMLPRTIVPSPVRIHVTFETPYFVSSFLDAKVGLANPRNLLHVCWMTKMAPVGRSVLLRLYHLAHVYPIASCLVSDFFRIVARQLAATSMQRWLSSVSPCWHSAFRSCSVSQPEPAITFRKIFS